MANNDQKHQVNPLIKYQCIYSLVNAIQEGKNLLEKIDLVEMRDRIHMRNKRFEKFQDNVYNNVISREETFDQDLSNLKDWIGRIPIQTYQEKYRLMFNE